MSKLPDPRTIIAALVIVSTTIYSAYSPWFVCTLGGFAAVMLTSATINPNTLVRGLGGTAKPTSVTVVKFRVVDAVILLIVIGFAIWRIVL